MLGAIAAAALVLTARPPDLVSPGSGELYAAWLDGQARKAAGYYAHTDCAAATVGSRSFGPITDEAIAKARPGAPLFLEILSIDNCGAAQAQGLVVYRQDGQWRALPTAPGESLASLAVQREVLPSVILAVKAAAERDTSCSALEKAQSALIYDTRVIRRAAPGQSWSERWFMTVCGAGYRIDIDFTPAAEGKTAYDVRVEP